MAIFLFISSLLFLLFCVGHSHEHDSEQNNLDSHSHQHIHSHKCGYTGPSHDQTKQIQNDLQEYRQMMGGKEGLSASKRETITVQTYFHVLSTENGTGELNDTVIEKQMEVLNDAFRGVTSSYGECGGLFEYKDMPSSPFVFNLTEVIRTADDEAFDGMSDESFVRRADLRRGTCSDLNIFSGNADLLGFAYFPANCQFDIGIDMVFINYRTVPDGSFDFFNEGDTLVHEVGHWLGLEHTFYKGCNLFNMELSFGFRCRNGENAGDFISDTPAQSSASFGCQIGRDSCPRQAGDDPIHNFMDYSDDCCMYTFTDEQIERMVLQAGLYRDLFA